MLSLAPLIASWSLFMISKNLVVALVTLLFSSLSLPIYFMSFFKVFWPCGLLLILMSTGLIVVFAYIVSLHEGGSKINKYTIILILLGLTLLLTSNKYYPHLSHVELKIMVEVLLSLFMIYILLFLVINFVRLVYSKGGGFRKKF